MYTLWPSGGFEVDPKCTLEAPKGIMLVILNSLTVASSPGEPWTLGSIQHKLNAPLTSSKHSCTIFVLLAMFCQGLVLAVFSNCRNGEGSRKPHQYGATTFTQLVNLLTTIAACQLPYIGF